MRIHIGFHMKFDVGKHAQRHVKHMVRDLRHLKWFWKYAVPVVARQHNEHFDTEGHGAWDPLAEMTRRYRERHIGYYASPSMAAGPDGPILHWTWRLRDSLSDFHPEGTMFSVRRLQRTKMFYGTRHPAAYELHHGRNANKREGPLAPRNLLDPERSLVRVLRLARKLIPRHMQTLKR